MFDNEEESHLLKGLISALFLEGFSVIVIIGLIRIVMALINTFLN